MKKKTLLPSEIAAYEHVTKLRPDGQIGGYPAWHGWALREAFKAGAEWQADMEAELAAGDDL